MLVGSERQEGGDQLGKIHDLLGKLLDLEGCKISALSTFCFVKSY